MKYLHLKILFKTFFLWSILILLTGCELVMDYHFDECMNGNSGTIKDYSDTANDAVLKHDTSNTDGLYAPTCTETGTVVCNNIQFKGYGYNISQSPWYHTSKYYIEAPDNSKISPLGSTAKKMTIYVWFKTSANGEQTILFKGGEASNTREYRLWIDNGTLKFTLFDKWGGAATLTIKTNVNDGQWHHVAVSSKLAGSSLSVKAYYDRSLSASNSFSYDGYPSTTNGKLYIGATYWGGGSIQNYLDGSIDELHMTDGEDSAADVADVYNAEKSHKTLNSSGNPVSRLCPCTCETPVTECTSFSYDLYHRQDSTLTPINRLHTRIANQPFEVNVTVACTNVTDPVPARKIKNLHAINGADSTCNAATPRLASFLLDETIDINDSIKTVTLTIPSAKNLKAYSNIRLMLETNASELNCSTDTMTIRPSSFSITTPTPIKAEPFTLTASAINSGGGYNGSASATTTIQNNTCPINDGLISFPNSPLVFSADKNSTEANPIDVGVITLNLKDTTWTTLDNPNDCIADSNTTSYTGISGKIGCNIENNTTVTITPHHFDVNATLSNFNGGTFTYLSNDANLSAMSADLNVIVTAQNDQNTTTQNYNTECYAKETTYSIDYDTLNITPSANLSKLTYFETNTSTSGNVATSATSFTLSNLPKTIFGIDDNGTAKLNILINFDRNETKFVNPFDLNISKVDVNDTDKVNGNDTTVGNATFVYGRIHAYDIKTDDNSSVPNPIELEVYSSVSSGFVNGMPQNILKWYRNTNHDTNLSGSVFSGNSSPDSLNINTTNNQPNNGIHIIEINNPTGETAKQKITLDIPSWLTISPANNTFIYQYLPNAGTTDKLQENSKGVNSGTFTGSDFEIQQQSNTTKKGIKVFR